MYSLIQPSIEAYAKPFKALIIGLSGGKDSISLLHLLKKNYKQKPIIAIHINHNLHPESKNWSKFCQTLCKQIKIPIIQENIHIEKNPKEGTEKKARIERYNCFKKHAISLNACVLTAHHLDDQIETFFLNLLRGSGLTGLSGIKKYSHHFNFTLIRPMLDIPQTQINQYVKQNKLEYVEDPSNQDTKIPRNYLRHQTLPSIQKIHPQYQKVIAQSIFHLNSEAQLVETLAKIDCQNQKIQSFPKMLLIPLSFLKNMTSIRAANCIRYLLKKQQWHLPPRWAIKQLTDQIIPHKGQISWSNICAQTFQQTLLIYLKIKLPEFQQPTFWKDKQNIENLGSFSTEISEKGIDFNLWKKHQQKITIQFKPFVSAIRLHQKKFKNLMQENKIPPFLRNHLPLIYLNDELISVSDLWINPSYIQKIGIKLKWHWYYKK